ncbi:alpha/beta fold hydrolase [Erythrobacter mangrovi]|uniref:Alpha/beta hydrolase n=1 Tax=Erythrobacter mangrovi TaxID=2739433 RepID=A0A7D3XBD4_9SPHN|nr:alpha/beta hydrolase [Erythrobacter mangrovi]QKG71160.1 alpha/beta hydrolase [Erythrobacter mangrovi]
MDSIKVNGVQLCFQDTGSKGEPIVFLHGFPMSHKVWADQVAELQSEFRCIVPDLRGFGRSESSDQRLTFDVLADDVAELIKSLGLPSAHIVGASLGAMLAMTFAARHPNLTRSVVVMHSEALPDDAESKLRRDDQIQFVRESGVEAFVSSFAPRLFPQGTDASIIERLRVIMARSSEESVIAGIKLLRDRDDMTPLLPSILAPALVVAGELDESSPIAWLEEMSHDFPNSRFHVLEGTGHLSIMERPDVVTALLRGWFEENIVVGVG